MPRRCKSRGSRYRLAYHPLARLNQGFSLGSLSADLKLPAGWRHAFEDRVAATAGAFDTSPPFRIAGARVARDVFAADVGIGLLCQAARGSTLFDSGDVPRMAASPPAGQYLHGLSEEKRPCIYESIMSAFAGCHARSGPTEIGQMRPSTTAGRSPTGARVRLPSFRTMRRVDRYMQSWRRERGQLDCLTSRYSLPPKNPGNRWHLSGVVRTDSSRASSPQGDRTAADRYREHSASRNGSIELFFQLGRFMGRRVSARRLCHSSFLGRV